MTDEEVFRDVGGIPIVQGNGDVAFNFGITPRTPEVMANDGPGLHDRFPALASKWDGETTINHLVAVRKVLGQDLSAHYQRSGTCGGHAGSLGPDILQCVMIATGQRAKFKPTSHAWPYFLARREYRMLGSGDGVPGGSIPFVLAKYGQLTREEAGDLYDTGSNVDTLADKWGAGRISDAEVKRLEELAIDNIVTVQVKARTAQELADGIASGGVGICSDGQGFKMTRDAEGVCEPKGQWWHYHVRGSVQRTPSRRKVFGYGQSWGPTTPSGPLLPDHPGNWFGVPWEVQDRTCRNGECDVIFAFKLFDLENDNIPDLSYGLI